MTTQTTLVKTKTEVLKWASNLKIYIEITNGYYVNITKRELAKTLQAIKNNHDPIKAEITVTENLFIHIKL